MLARYGVFFTFLVVFTGLCGCGTPPEKMGGQEMLSPDDPQLQQGPVFKQSRFNVYVVYRPQVQYRDFNGVFDITPGSARIVRKFWKEKFNELTRPGHYGEFFIEFFDYASSLAQTYPVDSREKELMLDSLEKSFHSFCMALNAAEAYTAFQNEQQRIYGD
ncbi:MAG: hypothetical protein ABIK28_09330 [Planctomycetota bacterium]